MRLLNIYEKINYKILNYQNMKKVIKMGMILAALLCFSFNMQAQKYGHVNSNAILESMPAVSQLEPALAALQKQLNKRLEQMVEGYKEKTASAQQKLERGEMSPMEQENKQKELMEEQQKIYSYEKDIQQKLMEKQQTLLEPILKEVNDAIQQVAKENSFTMIFDSAVLLYADENQDVSGLVKTKLGL